MELVAAQEARHRRDDGRVPAAEVRPGADLLLDPVAVEGSEDERPVADDDVRRVLGVVRLELPAGDRGIPGAGGAAQREQLERVLADRGQHVEGLLLQHLAVEVAGHLAAHARHHAVLHLAAHRDLLRLGAHLLECLVVRGAQACDPGPPDRRLGVVVQPVRAEQQLLRRVRAERPLVPGQPQGGAVRGLRHPAVDGAGRVGGQREAVQLRVGVVPVTGRQNRQREGQAQQPGLLEPRPPAWRHDQQVAQRGQDEDLADLPGGGRGAQGQASHHDQPRRRGGPPEQRDHAGHDQRLEHDVGHDVLLDLQLVGIEQDRGGGQGRQPARHAAAQQQQVDGDGHAQAQQVLYDRDHVQVAEREHRLERQLVAGRVVAGVGVQQVLGRVDVEQRRAVGDLGEDAQHQAGREQYGEQPVLAGDRRDLAGPLPQPREPPGLRAGLAGCGRGVTRGGHRHSHER